MSRQWPPPPGRVLPSPISLELVNVIKLVIETKYQFVSDFNTGGTTEVNWSSCFFCVIRVIFGSCCHHLIPDISSPRPDLPGFWPVGWMELPNRRRICRWFKERGWHWRNQEIKTTRQVMVLLCSFPKDIIVLFRLPSPVRKEDQESQPSFHSGSVHGEFSSNQCSQSILVVHKVSWSVHAAIWKQLACLVRS